jgi:NDP-sugar pyrophosphorylase family protein
MKALLICPGERPGVPQLADAGPLALAPLLGKSVLEYWIEHLIARGARQLLVLASDRPRQVRDFCGGGTRWGVDVDVIPESRELPVAEARAKYQADRAGWLPDGDVVVLDHLPGQPDRPLFESHAGWFAALQAWMPHAVTASRIGATQVEPGLWVGLHAQISPAAHLRAPCWIGDHAIVGPDAVIGPNAILEDRVVVERGATVCDSIVGPETFVGEMISVQKSLAAGNLLVNWANGSVLEVPDAFFLCCLDARRFAPVRSPWFARVLAFAAMLVTAPFALAWMALCIIRGEPPVHLRLGVRPQRRARRDHALRTFAYYELSCARNWLRRWPQFWNVVRGDLTWFGNRPLRPTQVLALANDFERLWLTAPAGLVSLADAQGCHDEPTDEVCAHAAFYAVNASRRLNWFIFKRTLLQVAMVWPLLWGKRRDAAVAIPQLVSKEG